MSMNTCWIRIVASVVSGVALLGGVGQARRPDTLNKQMAALAGTNLTRAECQQRMQDLGKLVQSAGYGPVRIQVYDDGTLVARWYHAGSKTTTLAFSGQKVVGNIFSANQYAGLLRWNEFRGDR